MKKSLLLSLLLPLSLFAQGLDGIQVSKLGDFINLFNNKVVASVGVLLMSLAIVTFFAGVVRFIWSVREGDGKAAQQGRQFMIWGLLGVFVIFSIYGLIYFFQKTIGVNGVTGIDKPCTNFITDCKSSGGTPIPVSRPDTGGGVGTGGGNTLGATSAGIASCRNIGGVVGIDGKCYQSTTGMRCFQGCVIGGDFVIYPNRGDTGNSGNLTACGQIGGTMGEDNKCYQNNASLPCYYGCEIRNGSVILPSTGGAGSGGVSGGVTAAQVCASVGTINADGKCYGDVKCLNGCTISNGQLIEPSGTISNADPRDCSLAQNNGNLCSVNGVTGYCDIDAGTSERYCKVFTDQGDTSPVANVSCNSADDEGKSCRISGGESGKCLFNSDNELTCQ